MVSLIKKNKFTINNSNVFVQSAYYSFTISFLLIPVNLEGIALKSVLSIINLDAILPS